MGMMWPFWTSLCVAGLCADWEHARSSVSQWKCWSWGCVNYGHSLYWVEEGIPQCTLWCPNTCRFVDSLELLECSVVVSMMCVCQVLLRSYQFSLVRYVRPYLRFSSGCKIWLVTLSMCVHMSSWRQDVVEFFCGRKCWGILPTKEHLHRIFFCKTLNGRVWKSRLAANQGMFFCNFL